MNPFFLQIIGAIVRAAILWLAAKFGAEISDDEVVKIVAQVVPVLAVLGWSVWQKFRSRQTLVTSLTTPHAITEQEAEAIRDDPRQDTPSVLTGKDAVPR